MQPLSCRCYLLQSPHTTTLQQSLPGAGADLERTCTSIWASPSTQQGYPLTHSNPNFIQTVTSAYSTTSCTTLATESSVFMASAGYMLSPYINPVVPVVACPPRAASPIIGAAHMTSTTSHRSSSLSMGAAPATRSTSNPTSSASLISVALRALKTLGHPPIVSGSATSRSSNRVNPCIQLGPVGSSIISILHYSKKK